VASVIWSDAKGHTLDKAAVCIRTMRGRRRTGYMTGLQLYGSDNDGPLRFPSVRISRERDTYFGVPWPPFTRAFSKPGDSGAWVILQNASDQWVAMVVSGDKRGGHTTAHLAAPLLRWLDLSLSKEPLPPAEVETWFKDDGSRPAVITTLSMGEGR
jgi:hypothetical protein